MTEHRQDEDREDGLVSVEKTCGLRDPGCDYKIYRDYMEHEDELLNQRTTWLLLIQGFLFATLGVLGEWQTTSGVPDTLHAERIGLIYVLAAVGIVIAAAALRSIRAAYDAIDSLCTTWDGLSGRYDETLLATLPPLAGGGHPSAKERGKAPALWIPRIILLAWAAVAVMATIDRLKPFTAPGEKAAQAEARPAVEANKSGAIPASGPQLPKR